MALTEISVSKQSGPALALNPDGTMTGKIRVEFDILTDQYNDDTLVAASYLPGVLGGIYSLGNSTSQLYTQTLRDAEKICNTTDTKENGSKFRGILEYTRRARTTPDVPSPPTAATPFTIDVSLTQRQEALDADRFGNPVVNSAGDRFSRPPMAKVGEIKWMINRQEEVNPVFKIIDYSPRYGCVNDSMIWGFPPRTLWLLITAKYSNQSGWSVTYNIEYNSETWDYNILDEGFFTLGPPDPQSGARERIQILDETKDNKPKQKPTLLNGNGGLAASTVAYFLYFEKAVPLNFYLLNLPDISTVR